MPKIIKNEHINTENGYDNYLEQTISPAPQTEAENLEKENLEKENLEKEKSSGVSKNSKWKRFIYKYWWVIPLVGVVLAVGGVTVMRVRNNLNEETATTQINPVSVSTTTAQLQPIRAWVSSEGNVRAVNFKHLAFEVEGDITYLARRKNRKLREGERVSKGELLARVDDRKLLADVRQSQAAIAEAKQGRAAAAAEVARAKSQVARADSQLQQARSQVKQATTNRDLARAELERYRQLYNQGAIAASEFDTRQSKLEDAQAQLEATRAQVGTAESEVDAAKAGVRATQEQLEATESQITTARARLTQAEVALEGASLYAPFDGIVAYLNIKEGEYYNPQIVSTQLAGDYQGILERIPIVVIDPSQFEVITDLATPSGERVRPGQTVLIDAQSDVQSNVSPSSVSSSSDNQSFIDSARTRGRVFSVNPAVSPGGRAIQATIRITHRKTDLQHGEQVLTWIAVKEENNAVVVPLNAVVFRDRQPYIFVVNRDKKVVEQRQVKLGITGINQREILEGVSKGELVVTQGQNRLVDGAPIRLVGE